MSHFPNLDLQWSAINKDLNQYFRGVIVSLSGGADSTALLLVLCNFAKRKKNLRLQALHINYGLRGTDSDADELFCRELCKQHNVPLEVVNCAETPLKRAGIQEWARNIRLARLENYKARGWIVATGHHQEDLAETILFRLIRGFSSGNLAGMEQWNGAYWRPFLDTPKEEIVRYLKSQGQTWRHDASNDGLDYARNRLRHAVIPVLRGIAPHAVENICHAGREAAAVGTAFLQSGRKTRTASDLAQIMQLQPEAAKYALRSRILNLAGDSDLSVSRPLLTLIYEYLRAGPAAKAVFDLSAEHTLVIERQILTLTKRRPSIKAGRIRQYASQTHLTDLHALAGAESYVFLRDSGAVWCIGPSGKSKGHSLEFEVKSARSGTKLKLPGWATGRSLKNIFQELAVPPEKRAQFRIVCKNGSQSALFDGEKFINPANLAMQATIEGINFILSKKA